MAASKRPTVHRITVYLFAMLVLYLAQPELPWLWIGASLAALGASLRIWATGHLSKNERLVVDGPYRHLRHPLYLGTWLCVTGMLVAAGQLVGLVFFQLCFFLYYFPRKEKREAARLERSFGADFVAFRRQVPSLVPRVRPASPLHATCQTRWSLEQVGRNSEWRSFTALLLVFCFLVFRYRALLP